MSDKTEAAAAKPKKGKGLIVKLLGALVLIGAGGGGTYALVTSGMIGSGEQGAKAQDNQPKLVRKGEDDPYAPKSEGKGAKAQAISMAKAAANIAPAISASARTLPRTSGIRPRWSRSTSPAPPAAMAGC